MLYNDEKTGPFPIAFSMIMLGWTEGEQYSGMEISEMLCEAGIREHPGEANVRLLGHRNGPEALSASSGRTREPRFHANFGRIFEHPKFRPCFHA